MNVIELKRALSQLRLGGIAAVIETRLHQAQAEPMAPIDLISCLVTDELTRRGDRLLERRRKAVLRRQPVVDRKYTAAARVCDSCDQVAVRRYGAETKASAVKIKNGFVLLRPARCDPFSVDAISGNALT